MIDSNDSWTEFVWVLPLEGNDIVRCAEIAIPSDNTATEDVSIILTMDSSVIENAQMEFKYQGKTHNNFQPDFRNALAFREGG